MLTSIHIMFAPVLCKELKMKPGRAAPAVILKTGADLRAELDEKLRQSRQSHQSGVFLDLFCGTGRVGAAAASLGVISHSLDIVRGYDLTDPDLSSVICQFILDGHARLACNYSQIANSGTAVVLHLQPSATRQFRCLIHVGFILAPSCPSVHLGRCLLRLLRVLNFVEMG